ncbi:hypothetical protein LX73_1945 [Fodinibius salinus]|uniref:Uncharacterized protein n=1 Tax=Fodinibius salinus TaxID=860790 RepID=A0A5D3YFY0_9BACT|nr:hypothetical protein [Fodinibius salinus]TYP92583.1 hypothetical protein LX73_1945 [Fodinibius salinus]
MDEQHSRRWVELGHTQANNKSDRRSVFSYFARRIHSRHMLYMMGGLSQVVLGLSVITVAILGLIKPLWISVCLTMAASITVIIGLFVMFTSVSKIYNTKSLLQQAMKRVMKSKN